MTWQLARLRIMFTMGVITFAMLACKVDNPTVTPEPTERVISPMPPDPARWTGAECNGVCE